MLKLKSGGNFVHVPYRGGAQAATDAIRARSIWCRWGLPRRGSPKAANEDPGAGRPEPASDAARRADHGRGRTAGRPMDTWFGLVGPPGMPKEIVARINNELAA